MTYVWKCKRNLAVAKNVDIPPPTPPPPNDKKNIEHIKNEDSPRPLNSADTKKVNPSTPLVYPNRRFRKITTPDANTYCVCSSAVTYFPTKSNKGTCSTPTPKCTSDSFFSLQTPHTTEQVNKNQGRHTATAHKQRKEARGSSVATVSSALGDTAVQFASEHLTPLP